jgi:hypothetical protein
MLEDMRRDRTVLVRTMAEGGGGSPRFGSLWEREAREEVARFRVASRERVR